jgi:MATE family multidrug resistance protein
MVGNLEGQDELAAIGLANVFCNVTGYSLIGGMASAIDTISSQAYGAKSYAKMGILLQRALLILLVTTALPTCILWFFADKVLLALHQPPSVCRLVQKYAVVRMPGLFMQCLQVVLQKTMYAMQMTRPALYVQIASSGV